MSRGAPIGKQLSRLTFLLAAMLAAGGCVRQSWNVHPSGRIRSDAIGESSGVVVSRRYDDVFWTHNDSDNPPELFAIDDTGQLIRRIHLEGVTYYDWEDIALDSTGTLHILDNGSLRDPDQRSFIYSFAEPNPFLDEAIGEVSVRTFRYPDQPYDSEALLAWEGKLYVVTKSWDGRLPRIYLIPEGSGELIAELQGEVPVHTMVTGGDVSPDGRGIILSSYRALLLWEGSEDPATLLQKDPFISQLNARQVEAVAWNGADLILTNEQRDIFEISLERLKQNRAPFLRTPRKSIPRLARKPSVTAPLKAWGKGRWLEADTSSGRTRIGRVGWTEAALYVGIELPPGVSLRTLPGASDDISIDDWFLPGALYVLLNPDGSRPMVYGQNDRCVIVGTRDDGQPLAVAHSLQPGTLIRGTESRPGWISIQQQERRLLMSVSLDSPGMRTLAMGREIGFNLILIENDGRLISWAPLTRRFTWDSPSVWGLLHLDR